nr:di-heme oxidoredictase family protein [uncultured Pseudoxanthomonas sp.]
MHVPPVRAWHRRAFAAVALASLASLAACSVPTEEAGDASPFWSRARPMPATTQASAGTVAASASTLAAAPQNIDVDPVPSGRYRIASVLSGLCVEIRDGHPANGTPLVQSACDATLNRQFFDIAETTTGQYRLRNLHTQKSADIPGASGADHVVVQQWDDNGSGAQRFRLQRIDASDRYRIVNVNSGKCLGIVGASAGAGASLEQVACAAVPAQQFHLGAGEPQPVRQNGSHPMLPPPPPVPPSASYQPLLWPDGAAPVQYTQDDGTLVTHVGGRVRDRHAREPIVDDSYQVFPPHYFERRTHEIIIHDDAVPGTSGEQRILTIVVKPQHYWYGTNFRHGYIGRRSEDPLEPTSVALYADNGGMKLLPGGVATQTPIPGYAQLGQDPNANYTPPAGAPGNAFVLVKEIRTAANDAHRPLRKGDLVEFELGIFLAGNPDIIGRFNYYAEALVYRAGSHGIVSWFRGPGYGVQRPLDSLAMPAEALSAGPWMTLHEDTSSEPYRMLQQASHNIAGYNMQAWAEGRRLIHTSFASGRHSEESNTIFTTHAGKTAPHFSQTRCVDCHTGNGRSSPVVGAPLDRLGVFVGVAGAGTQTQDPRFGLRLQQGTYREAGANIDGREAELVLTGYTEIPGRYADGTGYVLRRPNYALRDRAGQALALPTALSVRVAPSLVGLGLLEAVPEQHLERLVLAQQGDPDGVAGRLQIVADARDPGVSRVGRFGWKGGSATLEQQASLAFNTDMGVASPLMPSLECARGSQGAACTQVDTGSAKLTAADIQQTTLYLSLLGVPPRRDFDNPLEQDAQARARQLRVKRGAQLFEAARCGTCHAPELRTGHHRFVELRYQTIRPYTDLLLHDMGPELADTYVEGRATAREWRTAPLWGLGLAAAIDPNVRYLHDGRAATLEEAVLWHGGQGAAAKRRFEAMSAEDRRALVDFLKSL